MTPTAEKTEVKIVYVNEQPEVPESTEHVKFEVKEVSRTIKTVEGETQTTKYLLVPIALTTAGMTAIAGDDLQKALKYFNDGFFSAMRVKASNELSGGSEEDKAFARVVKAVKNLPMFSGKSDEDITESLRNNPALMALFSK